MYLEAIGATESDEFYREKALEALEVYKQVPLAERTENFYERHRIVLRDLKKSGYYSKELDWMIEAAIK